MLRVAGACILRSPFPLARLVPISSSFLRCFHLSVSSRDQTSAEKAPESPAVQTSAPARSKLPSWLLAAAKEASKEVRVDNLLSQAGFCARRDARQFCRKYEVLAQHEDGTRERIMVGRTKVAPSELRVEGEALEYAGEMLHLVMHKPPGVVCTHSDYEGKSVYDLLPTTFGMRKPLLSTVGRLDKMASGLLILTQNGKLNALLSNPTISRGGCAKEYVVSLEDELSESGVEAAAFSSGRLQLVDGSICEPAALVPHATRRNICKVTLTQGRHHQIRRMFASVGHAVTGIHRVAFGGLRLPDLGLAEGQWRQLTEDELSILTNVANRPQDPAMARSRRIAAQLPRLEPQQRMRVRLSVQRERAADTYAEDVAALEAELREDRKREKEERRTAAAAAAAGKAGGAGGGGASTGASA